MACDKQQFPNITPDKYASMQALAAANDVILSGDSGQAVVNSPVGKITLAYAYNPDSQSLDIQCISKPFIVSCGTVNAKIHDLMVSPDPVI